MKAVLAVLLVVHGLLHSMGFVKAFGLAPVARLRQPIGRPLGILWLVAGLAFVGAAVLLFALPPIEYNVGAADLRTSDRGRSGADSRALQ